MWPTTEQLATFLQAVGYHAVNDYPYLIVYLHLLVSAIFPIYTGAHASLSRPSSAAKPSNKTKKRNGDDDEPEEQEQRMESLGPIDALLLPFFAGLSLAGLYVLIKWLEDPALLNKILNWYFAIFGVWSLAQMIRDTMGVLTSFAFPKTCDVEEKFGEIGAKSRKFEPTSSPSVDQSSPASQSSSAPSWLSKSTNYMSTLRQLLSRQLDVRLYIHKLVQAQFKIGPQDVISLFLAVVGLAYFNLVDKPWWLTNLLGFSFAYSALQMLSPTTSWTGTLILAGLFIYDIYFVFFTPLMVIVATQLDIPAKLLFPRPRRPTEDPTKQAVFMLGLGDIVLPGMMIGFALRFDLYLFYLRKQIQRTIKAENTTTDPASKEPVDNKVTKATWHPATGGWGERFWNSKNEILRSKHFQGVLFPKTYFHASVFGYIMGMLCTLGVMEIYGQAQPALLYLVPGILGSLWGTALVKGDIKTLWAFDESKDDQKSNSPSKSEKQESIWKSDSWMEIDWKGLFLSQKTSNKSKKPREPVKNNDVGESMGTRGRSESTSTQSSVDGPQEAKNSRAGQKSRKEDKDKGVFDRDRKSELIFVSVSFSKAAKAKSSKATSIPEQATSSAHVGHRTRARAKVEDDDDDGLGETY